jgi:hypothetical protein
MSSLVKARKTFKVVLDSNDTNSFTGNQFNATYFIDLNKIIFDNEDYDKCYEMTVRFVSRSGDPSVTLLNMNTTYTLYIDLGKGVSTYQFRNQRPISAVLSVMNDFTSYTSTVCPTFWDTKDSDNAPSLVSNLRNISAIGLTVMQSSNNAIFNSANNATINTNTKYICVLTFREI